jgi:hypothetical protein
MEARVQGRGPTQGFNLLQMSPNWFLQIWTLGPPLSKVGLKYILPCKKGGGGTPSLKKKGRKRATWKNHLVSYLSHWQAKVGSHGDYCSQPIHKQQLPLTTTFLIQCPEEWSDHWRNMWRLKRWFPTDQISHCLHPMMMMTMKNKNLGGRKLQKDRCKLLVEVSQPAGFPSFTAGDASWTKKAQ